MKQLIATIIYVAVIIWLFHLDRDAKVRTSRALWIPVIWLLIIGSRPVSMWLHVGPAISRAEVYTEGSPIDATVFGILIAAGLVVLSLRSRQVGRFLWANLPLVLFFAYCALSIAWSDYSKRWIKAVGDLVMVLVVLTDPNPLAATRRFFSRAGFVLLPLSVLFIKYYPSIGRSFSKDWMPTYGGVTTQKNSLGMICLVCGLGSLWAFIGAYRDRTTSHRVRHLAAHGIIVAVAIWLFITSNSMTALSCFVMAGTVMVMTMWRYFIKRPLAVHAIVGGCVFLSLFALFFDTSGMLVHTLGRNTNLTGRTDIWKAVLSMHTNPLVGTGFESFWMGRRLERVDEILKDSIQEAHNGYLELYLNLGWIGLVLLAGVIVTGYRNVLAVFRRDPDAGRIRLALFTAGVIYSFSEAGFRMMSPIWIAFLLAVTFVPPGLQQQRRRRASQILVNGHLSRKETGTPQEAAMPSTVRESTIRSMYGN